jgi:hypothetical protein
MRLVLADISIGAWLAILFFGGVAVLVIVARLFGPGSGSAELLDFRPEQHAEHRAELDAEDLQQLMARENERRRAAGRREITEAELEMYGPAALTRD